ncbi:hypothetical protein [Rhodoblastus sp.]|jgi:hypothetical protein|uniref:hypothetical protein n=1 Tax=Rhodoblastus sp. TaxID=1962975 RepID=UPI0025E2451E|nr:hypothetical protein [Rhodoblastus sp.]
MDSSFTRGFAGQPAGLQSIVAGRLWRNYDDSRRRALEKTTAAAPKLGPLSLGQSKVELMILDAKGKWNGADRR